MYIILTRIMTLNKKLSILILSFLLMTVLFSLFIMREFSRVMDMREYEMTAISASKSLQKLVSYSDSVFSSAFEFDYLSENWEYYRSETESYFDSLRNSSVLKMFDSDTHRLFSEVFTQWNSLQATLYILSDLYELIQEYEIEEDVKHALEEEGLIIGFYKTKESLSFIQEAMNSIRESQKSLVYANELLGLSLATACDELTNQSRDNYSRSVAIIFIVIIVASVVVFIFAKMIVGKVIARVHLVRDASDRLAEGDLCVSLSDNSNDEVGELVRDIQKTAESLKGIIHEVKDSAKAALDFGNEFNTTSVETAEVTNQIRTSIESLNRQFNELEESVDNSMKKLKNMSDIALSLVVDNKLQFTAISENTADITEITHKVASITEMSRKKSENAEIIQQYVADGDEKIGAAKLLLAQVTGQLDEIGDVIEMINAVAEQTNILSMNAAIESAHAGEAGRGFGVVAEEIRNLAESTAENAQKIAASIYGIITKVREADTASFVAAEAFARVEEQSSDLSQALKDISMDIRLVDEKISEIDKRTHAISETASKISGQCEILNDQQILVSESMVQMHGIFSDSKAGVDAIRQGAADIVDRMAKVSELSSDSSTNMKNLSERLEEFKTEDAGVKTEETNVRSAGTSAESAVYSAVLTDEDFSDEAELLSLEDEILSTDENSVVPSIEPDTATEDVEEVLPVENAAAEKALKPENKDAEPAASTDRLVNFFLS